MAERFDAELRNWALVRVGAAMVAVGRVFSDSKGRWPDGHMIRTSSVIDGVGQEGEVISTLNTRYLLSGLPMDREQQSQIVQRAANAVRRGKIVDDERLFDLLQAAWGMDDQTFEAVAGLPERWLWQWRNHYRAPTVDDLACVRRLARFHDALRIISYDAPNYAEWWSRRWREDSLIGARSPLTATRDDPAILGRLERYLWSQM
ncbi:hypothetical protein [Sphingomonas arenae]|uniref:hypothetical protein n=1 Tax=Sphingomonas arenae TaxID=2812555 RepID=UPI0019676C86|nr:hypothetical protein [Sphingomonas arenae]